MSSDHTGMHAGASKRDACGAFLRLIGTSVKHFVLQFAWDLCQTHKTSSDFEVALI